MLRNDGEKAQNILTKFLSKICSYRDPSFSIKTKLFIETSNIYYRMRRSVLIMRLCLLHTNVAYTKSFMKFYKIAKKSTPIGTGHKFLIHKVNQGI